MNTNKRFISKTDNLQNHEMESIDIIKTPELLHSDVFMHHFGIKRLLWR